MVSSRPYFVSHCSPFLPPEFSSIASSNRGPTFQALAKLFQTEQLLTKEEADADAGLTAIDHEEQAAGYQAAYSRLAAAEAAPVDPVAHVQNLKAFVGQELARVSARDSRVKGWISTTDVSVTGPFVQALAASGYNF